MSKDAGVKVKVALIGPCESGKSVIANFLSDATENSIEEYHPTHVVRILEFESPVTQGNRQSRADVELWDCSGSSRFSTSWPAIVWELHGVIFVFNPDNESHGADLDFYYDNFVKKSGLLDSNCIVFAHVRGGSSNKKAKLSKNFGRIPQLEVNLEDEANGMRADFQRFIGTLASNLSERRDQVEMNIMSMRG